MSKTKTPREMKIRADGLKTQLTKEFVKVSKEFQVRINLAKNKLGRISPDSSLGLRMRQESILRMEKSFQESLKLDELTAHHTLDNLVKSYAITFGIYEFLKNYPKHDPETEGNVVEIIQKCQKALSESEKRIYYSFEKSGQILQEYEITTQGILSKMDT